MIIHAFDDSTQQRTLCGAELGTDIAIDYRRLATEKPRESVCQTCGDAARSRVATASVRLIPLVQDTTMLLVPGELGTITAGGELRVHPDVYAVAVAHRCGDAELLLASVETFGALWALALGWMPRTVEAATRRLRKLLEARGEVCGIPGAKPPQFAKGARNP